MLSIPGWKFHGFSNSSAEEEKKCIPGCNNIEIALNELRVVMFLPDLHQTHWDVTCLHWYTLSLAQIATDLFHTQPGYSNSGVSHCCLLPLQNVIDIASDTASIALRPLRTDKCIGASNNVSASTSRKRTFWKKRRKRLHWTSKSSDVFRFVLHIDHGTMYLIMWVNLVVNSATSLFGDPNSTSFGA